jgi:threonine dehydratase
MMSGQIPGLKGKRVALVVCGGNIDPVVLGRVIEKGLVHDGRLTRFTVRISDRPGGLAELCRVIASCGASVNQVDHDRAFSGPDVTATHVVCTVETRDRDHVAELHRALRKAGFRT